jgi:hypothetical protein
MCVWEVYIHERGDNVIDVLVILVQDDTALSSYCRYHCYRWAFVAFTVTTSEKFFLAYFYI